MGLLALSIKDGVGALQIKKIMYFVSVKEAYSK